MGSRVFPSTASSSTGDCGLGSEPGSSVEDLRLGYRGTEGLKVGADGDLLVLTSLGVLKDAAPVGYQLIGGERIPVESRYGHGDYGFRVGAARLLQPHGAPPPRAERGNVARSRLCSVG